jgi:hypothetical protein
MHELETIRRRDGAVMWGFFSDIADPRRYVEAYMVETGASTCVSTIAEPPAIVSRGNACVASSTLAVGHWPVTEVGRIARVKWPAITGTIKCDTRCGSGPM